MCMVCKTTSHFTFKTLLFTNISETLASQSFLAAEQLNQQSIYPSVLNKEIFYECHSSCAFVREMVAKNNYYNGNVS